MNLLELGFHPFGFGLVLFPVWAVAPCSHFFRNPLVYLLVSMHSVELLLGLILTPVADKIHHLFSSPILSPAVGSRGRWSRLCHDTV